VWWGLPRLLYTDETIQCSKGRALRSIVRCVVLLLCLQRSDWIPRRPSATPRLRDPSPAMTPSLRESNTPSYRMYDAPYSQPPGGQTW